MQLTGKTVLITGAARGIGRTTAGILADAGAAVGVADVQADVEATAAAIRARGGRSVATTFDVADPAQVTRGIQVIRETLGDIDVLVSNAGIVNNIAPLTKMTHERWERELAVNLTGAFNLMQGVIEPMIRKGSGRIIVISSGAARGGLHNQSAYAASKAGLLGLVHTVVLEYARYGISCNAILPGLIETELVRMMPVEIRDAALGNTPARRLGKMEEVGQLITFLASDLAGFINGAEIDIDGGMRLNTGTLGSRREVRGVAAARGEAK